MLPSGLPSGRLGTKYTTTKKSGRDPLHVRQPMRAAFCQRRLELARAAGRAFHGVRTSGVVPARAREWTGYARFGARTAGGRARRRRAGQLTSVRGWAGTVWSKGRVAETVWGGQLTGREAGGREGRRVGRQWVVGGARASGRVKSGFGAGAGLTDPLEALDLPCSFSVCYYALAHVARCAGGRTGHAPGTAVRRGAEQWRRSASGYVRPARRRRVARVLTGSVQSWGSTVCAAFHSPSRVADPFSLFYSAGLWGTRRFL